MNIILNTAEMKTKLYVNVYVSNTEYPHQPVVASLQQISSPFSRITDININMEKGNQKYFQM